MLSSWNFVLPMSGMLNFRLRTCSPQFQHINRVLLKSTCSWYAVLFYYFQSNEDLKSFTNHQNSLYEHFSQHPSSYGNGVVETLQVKKIWFLTIKMLHLLKSRRRTNVNSRFKTTVNKDIKQALHLHHTTELVTQSTFRT